MAGTQVMAPTPRRHGLCKLALSRPARRPRPSRAPLRLGLLRLRPRWRRTRTLIMTWAVTPGTPLPLRLPIHTPATT